MPIQKNKGVRIGDRNALEAWIEAGSTEKAALLLAKRGIVNAQGVPFASMAVWVASMRYIIQNFDEACKYLIEETKAFGSKEELIAYLIRKGSKALPCRSDYASLVKRLGVVDQMTVEQQRLFEVEPGVVYERKAVGRSQYVARPN